MFSWLWHLFDTSGFPPRWNCGDGWAQEPIVGWLHIGSDLAIFASYYAVPLVVAWYVIRKSGMKEKFPMTFWVFLALVFFSCGAVHLIEAGIFWWPHYRLSALFKLLTAVVSSVGVVVLFKSLPRALDLKTPEQLQAEIKERQQAEANLDFERNLLHTLMNHLPDSIYFKDTSGKFLRISQSLANNLDLDDAAAAIGKSESDFLPKGHQYEAADAQVLQTGEAIFGHIEHAPWRDSDGSWLLTSRLPLQDKDGQSLGTFGISHDITSIKKAEERISTLAHKLALPRQGSDKTRSTIQLSDFQLQDMITCGSDIRGMGLHCESRPLLERGIVEYLYRSMKDDDGHPAFALVRLFQTVVFSEMSTELQEIARAVAPEHDLQPDTRCLVLRGTTGTDPQWNDPLRSEGHRVVPLPSIESVEQLPMIAQLIRQLGIDPDGIISGRGKLLVKDVGTNVFHVPDAKGSEYIPAQENFVETHGIESVVGFGDVLPTGDLFAVICFSRVPISRETAVLFSHLSISAKLALLALEPPGERVEAQIHAVDTLLQNYEQVVCRQEASLRSAMSELKSARDAADTANRAKSEFLANMSHEIRTPMNAIIGMTELVLEGDVSDSEREYLTTVLESGESLLNIINEILDFSKIEAGKLELDPSEFNIRDEVGDMVRSLAIRAHRKGLELACEVHSDVPAYLVADVARLRQVIINLTGNAIKFTEHGEVVVRVDAPHVGKDHATLRFAVADTGIGIAKEKCDSIFDAFAQADTSTTRVHGGTGLGLAISANIVRKMGGEINLKSKLGAGSEFFFNITVPIGQGDCAFARVRPEDVHGLSALLVDDNETNLHILKKLLESWGLQPIAVTNGQEALERLENWTPPLPILITDVHMPNMDGFQLVQRVRENESISSISIIVLTSGAGADDPQRCQELEVAAHLMKPVKQAEMLNALLLAHSGKPVATTPGQSNESDPPTTKPLRVLLVEDGLANQKLAIGMLNRWGHSVNVAENGAIAVEMYQTAKFDLVFMDLQMPVMDGLEATRRIREKESGTGSRVPIIAMTAHALVGDRDRCIEAGMDHYISKPIRKRDLATALEMFDRPQVDSEDTHETTKVSTTQLSGEVAKINLDAALEAMENDQAILVSVIEAFIAEAPSLLKDFADAAQSRDQAVALRSAHTLKGNFAILQQSDEKQLWQDLETLARNGELESLSARAEQAGQISERAIDALKGFLADLD